ncbi:MAG: hypothetical protein AB8B59_06390, partial [Maribacter sp.]
MNKHNYLICTIIFLLGFQSCTTTYLIKKGSVTPTAFHEKLEFETIKTVLILPLDLNGIRKNFIFDTGAQISVIQRDSMTGNISDWGGASKRRTDVGSEYVKVIKIGSTEFQDTYAGNTDFVGLKEQIPNFGGLIGQPIISKANWLIDYPKKTLEISNAELVDSSFQGIQIHRKGGSPHTYIEIDQEKYEVIIDFGSSSELSVPEDSELAKALFGSYAFKEQKRERYTMGGNETIIEKVGTLPLVKLGDIEFQNVLTRINVNSEPRLGISFFKNYIIYIDNENEKYRIKKG